MEAVIAVSSLVIGIGIGWWIHAKAAPAGDDAELRTALEAKTVAETNLTNLQGKFEEEKARLVEIREAMGDTFKAMAADIANANSKAFLERANEQFKSLKAGSEQDLDEKKKLIDKTLSGMNDKLENIHKQSTALQSSIDTSQKTTAALSETTIRLREILSSSQQRGQWGERMVTDILQVIGFIENVNYTRQSQTESGQRPDFTFLLPQDKKLNMDVKFPLVHYENYLSADSDEARAQKKTAFLKDVKNHVKSVFGREYINPAEGTLEYVMLFIPNESIYGFINREDADLVDYALQNHVLLCSPLTLYAVLSLIHQAARNFTMNERASEVMNLVDEFRKQWGKYVAQMDKLGNQIEGLTKDFNILTDTRTRALQRPLDRIENISLDVPDAVPGETPALPE